MTRGLLLAVAAWWTFFLFPEHQMGFDLRYLYPLVPTLLAFAAAVALTAVLPYRHLDGEVQEKRDYGAGGARSHAPAGSRHVSTWEFLPDYEQAAR